MKERSSTLLKLFLSLAIGLSLVACDMTGKKEDENGGNGSSKTGNGSGKTGNGNGKTGGNGKGNGDTAVFALPLGEGPHGEAAAHKECTEKIIPKLAQEWQLLQIEPQKKDNKDQREIEALAKDVKVDFDNNELEIAAGDIDPDGNLYESYKFVGHHKAKANDSKPSEGYCLLMADPADTSQKSVDIKWGVQLPATGIPATGKFGAGLYQKVSDGKTGETWKVVLEGKATK